MMSELYIAATDYKVLEEPRRCKDAQKLIVNNRACLAVSIDEPINVEQFGFRAGDIYDLLLVGRFEDKMLHRLDSFPIEVHVFVQPSAAEPLDWNKPWEELLSIAWARLYDNYSDAKQHKIGSTSGIWGRLRRMMGGGDV